MTDTADNTERNIELPYCTTCGGAKWVHRLTSKRFEHLAHDIPCPDCKSPEVSHD